MNQCFKITRGTDYDKAVKKHFKQKPLWHNVFVRVSAMLNEKIDKMALVPDELWVEFNDLTKDENKKLFGKNGKLKNNTKRAKETLEQYRQIVTDEGLSDFRQLGEINFIYGVMRFQGEELSSFVTSENDIYYQASFNLQERSEGLVETISEIEYQEMYLKELKNKSA
ncbi:hypothetical protein [Paenibacillus cremeus]|uniref:Uncharacterized protein n=1 Tax=Paenibacillus cremeus TaxID=2163881 RepID=A0A559KCJ6_9BACL|nr:hypothetical protein [Paenibacillus cremeus]TVY09854.1 hypothetical protein FPZ49_10805 [Paenibacillus cremeus]